MILQSLLIFHRNLATKAFAPSSVTRKGQRPQRFKFIQRIFSKGNSSIPELWQVRVIWRNIKKNLRIMILVSKLDPILQSNRAATVFTNETCKGSCEPRHRSHKGIEDGRASRV